MDFMKRSSVTDPVALAPAVIKIQSLHFNLYLALWTWQLPETKMYPSLTRYFLSSSLPTDVFSRRWRTTGNKWTLIFGAAWLVRTAIWPCRHFSHHLLNISSKPGIVDDTTCKNASKHCWTELSFSCWRISTAFRLKPHLGSAGIPFINRIIGLESIELSNLEVKVTLKPTDLEMLPLLLPGSNEEIQMHSHMSA